MTENKMDSSSKLSANLLAELRRIQSNLRTSHFHQLVAYTHSRQRCERLWLNLQHSDDGKITGQIGIRRLNERNSERLPVRHHREGHINLFNWQCLVNQVNLLLLTFWREHDYFMIQNKLNFLNTIAYLKPPIKTNEVQLVPTSWRDCSSSNSAQAFCSHEIRPINTTLISAHLQW